jgi:hypothetical protein
MVLDDRPSKALANRDVIEPLEWETRVHTGQASPTARTICGGAFSDDELRRLFEAAAALAEGERTQEASDAELYDGSLSRLRSQKLHIPEAQTNRIMRGDVREVCCCDCQSVAERGSVGDIKW